MLLAILQVIFKLWK